MRLFIATSLPQELKEKIGHEVSALRRNAGAGSWPRPETYHLTYAFLDEQPPELVPRLDAALRESLAERAGFAAVIGGSGFFPSAKRPRVGWLALEPREEFVAIAEQVRNVLRSTGLEAETRSFVPHLTLVRVKDAWSAAEVDAFTNGLGSLQGLPFDVRAVSIYESRLSPHGATHTALRNVGLSDLR